MKHTGEPERKLGFQLICCGFRRFPHPALPCYLLIYSDLQARPGPLARSPTPTGVRSEEVNSNGPPSAAVYPSYLAQQRLACERPGGQREQNVLQDGQMDVWAGRYPLLTLPSFSFHSLTLMQRRWLWRTSQSELLLQGSRKKKRRLFSS